MSTWAHSLQLQGFERIGEGGLFFHHFFEWLPACLTSVHSLSYALYPAPFSFSQSLSRHRNVHEWGRCEWVTDALGPGENQLCVHSASGAPELEFTSWNLRERNLFLCGRSVMCVWVFRFMSSFENFTRILSSPSGKEALLGISSMGLKKLWLCLVKIK